MAAKLPIRPAHEEGVPTRVIHVNAKLPSTWRVNPDHTAGRFRLLPFADTPPFMAAYRLATFRAKSPKLETSKCSSARAGRLRGASFRLFKRQTRCSMLSTRIEPAYAQREAAGV